MANSIVIKRRPPTQIERPFERVPTARGTRELAPLTQPGEAPMGDRWLWSLQVEYLVRNIAIAGGLELAYRLGRSHSDFERLRFGRKKKPTLVPPSQR